jgi:hypothetical protein
MVAEIRTNFDISDEQAPDIREVTEEKTKDRAIQATVEAHREDHFYLEGPFKPPTPNAGATMNWLRTHTLIPAQFSTSWPSRSSTIFTPANYNRRHSERCRRQMMAPRSFDLPPRRGHFTFFCAFRLSAQYFFIR